MTRAINWEKIESELPAYRQDRSVKNALILLVAYAAIAACVTGIMGRYYKDGPLRHYSPALIGVIIGASGTLAGGIGLGWLISKGSDICTEFEALDLATFLKEDEYLSGQLPNKKKMCVRYENGKKPLLPIDLRMRRDGLHPFILLHLVAVTALGVGLLSLYKIKPFDCFIDKRIPPILIVEGATFILLSLIGGGTVAYNRSSDLPDIIEAAAEQAPEARQTNGSTSSTYASTSSSPTASGPSVGAKSISNKNRPITIERWEDDETFKTQVLDSIRCSNKNAFLALITSEEFITCSSLESHWRTLVDFADKQKMADIFPLLVENFYFEEYASLLIHQNNIDHLRRYIATGAKRGLLQGLQTVLRKHKDSHRVDNKQLKIINLTLQHMNHDLNKDDISVLIEIIYNNFYDIEDSSLRDSLIDILLNLPQFLPEQVKMFLQKAITLQHPLPDKTIEGAESKLILFQRAVKKHVSAINFNEILIFAYEHRANLIVDDILEKYATYESVADLESKAALLGDAEMVKRTKALRKTMRDALALHLLPTLADIVPPYLYNFETEFVAEF